MKNNILEKYMEYPEYMKELFDKLIKENIISCNKNFLYPMNIINIHEYLNTIDIIDIIKNSHIIKYEENYIPYENNKIIPNHLIILDSCREINNLNNNISKTYL